MSSAPVVFPPLPWTNQDIVLYHGTVDLHVASILKGTILTGKGRTHRDFGPGFYTTTKLRQAHTWAGEIADSQPETIAAVIKIILPREDLAGLDTLAFVSGDFGAKDFWSFVHYCRNGATNHKRVPAGYFDVVYGPVAAFWNQRMIIADADQISFHTAAAEKILNKQSNLARRRRVV